MARELLKVRKYRAGYELRREKFSGRDYGVPDNEFFEMTSAFTPSGQYIGDSRIAFRLIVKRGIKPEYRTEHSNVCSIGFCEREQKWYGWSHRGICGFGVGDKLFDEMYPSVAETPFVKRGFVTIQTLDEARQAACNFAEYVS